MSSRAVSTACYSESFQDLLPVFSLTPSSGEGMGGIHYASLTSLCRSDCSEDIGQQHTLRNVSEVAEDTTMPVRAPCPSVTHFIPTNSEHWTVCLWGDLIETLCYPLGQLRHRHVLSLPLLEDLQTQEGRRGSQETNNIWKCPCKVCPSLSDKNTLN